ncbi:MAG: transcription termination factor NusA [Actinomycetota bacterium]
MSINFREIHDAMQNLEREKNIPYQSLIDGLQVALAAAHKRSLPPERGCRAEVDLRAGEVRIFEFDVDEEGQPMLDDDGAFVKERRIETRPFGRIEAQTARQVILQRIREAEREVNVGEYRGKEGDVVSGTIQQSDGRFVLLDLGKVEAFMPRAEQAAGEIYRHNERLKAYIVEIRQGPKGPSIVVSRTHPGLVKSLFAMEVPEIEDGTVEIKAVAREAGARSKVAVASNDPDVDAVGACVGPRGQRVRAIVEELNEEKIDLIPWSEDTAAFVGAALSPAKVISVELEPEGDGETLPLGTAICVVPDEQLSLAIGREGQNARLAAKLTGWRIDIKSQSQQSAGDASSLTTGEVS